VTKTRAEVIAMENAWHQRLTQAREDWDVTLASEGFAIAIKISMASFILETGLTPETIEAYVEEQVAEFELEARRHSKRTAPKWGHSRAKGATSLKRLP
jgi:hypothetical protein